MEEVNEFDEVESAAIDSFNTLPEPINHYSDSEEDDPNPQLYDADTLHPEQHILTPDERLVELVFQLAVAL